MLLDGQDLLAYGELWCAPVVGRLTGLGYGTWLIFTGLALLAGCLLWLAHGVAMRQGALLVRPCWSSAWHHHSPTHRPPH
jgi:hypothetical protein